MEKRLTMILACLFLSLGIALAQSSVTGTVIHQDDGQPIIGATVRVAGTNTGTVTDADGKFSITLPSGHDKLQVSYVGMVTQEVTVKGRNVTVTLEADQTNLDEVMVVAYGTAKKSAFTGKRRGKPRGSVARQGGRRADQLCDGPARTGELLDEHPRYQLDQRR